MSGLFSAIQIAGNALSAHSRVLEVTQNNLVNASTPGYARQDASLVAGEFNPALGLLGGVRVGPATNSRSEFAESNVRTQRSCWSGTNRWGGCWRQSRPGSTAARWPDRRRCRAPLIPSAAR